MCLQQILWQSSTTNVNLMVEKWGSPKSLTFIQNGMLIHLTDVEIFHIISKRFNLLVALQDKSEDHHLQ